MKNICIVAPPFNGHLNPLLGIGVHLAKRASVTVISTPSTASAIEKAGLKLYPVLGHREALIHNIATPGREVKSNPLRLFRQFKANVSMQSEMLSALKDAIASIQPALVISDFTIPMAGIAAYENHIRWWTTTPSPCVFETPDGPPAYCGGLQPATTLIGRAYHQFLRLGIRIAKRLMFQCFRRTFTTAGIPSVYREDNSERVYSPELVLALGIHKLEFQRTYPPHFHLIGPILYTPSIGGCIPTFEKGKKHILVTIGTHLDHYKNKLAKYIQELAMNQSDCIFHFSDGSPGNESVIREPYYHRYSFVSYEEYLHGYDIVIHHGGTGVMYHCLKHGIRSIVLPLDFDQFDNAARLEHAGVAVRIKKMSQIKGALNKVFRDPNLTKNCRDFSECIAAYHPEQTIDCFFSKFEATSSQIDDRSDTGTCLKNSR